MKEKILQALTTFKLIQFGQMATFSGGLYYRLLRGAFRCILWPLRRDCGRRRERALRQFQQERNPGSLGFHFFGSRCTCRCP